MGIAMREMAGDSTPKHNNLLAIIIPVVLGSLIILIATLIGFGITKRRRDTKRRFNEARLRDPSLTWEEFDRRGNLTRSRLLVEEDLLRSAMIRKTQQDKASASREAVGADGVQPTRSRSKTWHGRTKSQDVDREDGRQLLQESGLDWGSAQASVERTWQLLHGKKYPPTVDDRRPRDDNDEGSPERPPTVRLKTPPLLSHPVFRGWPGQYPPKHTSLPTELTRVQTEPGTVSSLTATKHEE
ncbi:hypothetical protein VP1G_02960 [Cytospora mali]|uniref:Uncharacterized protein n=1 Tax=Cytospora mali TaxID=578113 RepID=A0A194UV99_CYTMA|nr:hypothetical protein VP1G_02960 [Valsa mali var. pyri (nom. inval.)]